MSYLKVIDIQCDQCGKWVLGLPNNIGRARSELKSQGWSVVHGQSKKAVAKDVCDECNKQNKENKP